MAHSNQAGPPQNANPGDILVVIHDFQARSVDELTLKRGEKIEVVELDDGFGDGWYLGKHIDGNGTGLFPGVYTRIAPNQSRPLPSSEPSNPPLNVYGVSLSQAPYSNAQSTEEESRSLSINVESTPQAPRHVSTGSGLSDDGKRSSSMTITSASPIPANIQRSISETMGNSHTGEDSPVMNETLSVIDEHITDLSTPRHSMIAEQHLNDSASEYSNHIDHRLSYLTGPETDEEDGDKPTEEDVKQWDAKTTAQRLRDMGVDVKHCDIFEEQEITGDVLLEMDQAFIHMKEYDFGVMGRRLKTWHKIRAFQEEIKGPKKPRKSSSYSGMEGSSDSLERYERSQSRTGTLLPRIPSLMEKPGSSHRQSKQFTTTAQKESPAAERTQTLTQSPISTTSPLAPWRSSGQESPSRPSAASIRELNHSRRHSSMDVTSGPSNDSPRSLMSQTNSPFSIHRKQSSFDRNWSMTSAGLSMNSSLGGFAGPTTQSLNRIAVNANANNSNPAFPVGIDTLADEFDRGYFSGGELENRRARNVLRKRDSTGASISHSRNSSAAEDLKVKSMRRHSRFGSADSIRDLVPQFTSPAAKAYHSNTFKGRFRSVSARAPNKQLSTDAVSPTVTNLENSKASPSSFLLTPSPKPENDGYVSGNSSLSSQTKPPISKGRRMIGLRAISDAVTGGEKASAAPSKSMPSPVKESPVQSPIRTDSSTPSLDNTDVSSKGVEAPVPTLFPKAPGRSRTKSKKETSAYTRGLEKKTPAEQKIGADHFGWMKKKSSSLVTTWKPRLFILRGRRLSYYYSEEDGEEKGIIDISGHKVLVDNDAITAFHATITGAAPKTKGSQDDKAALSTSSDATKPEKTKASATDGPFYFKLVPPRAGFSRAVQFTKPAVHYFQVDNIREGRKWMGELMKATIERDPSMRLETTNKQNTISLTKARARKERPPALMATDESIDTPPDGPKSDETGLNIRGLNLDNEATNEDSNGAAHKKNSSVDGFKASILGRFSSEKKTAKTELLPETADAPS